MANLPVNTKSFNLANIASKAFNVVVSGFQFVTSLFFRVRSTIAIDFVFLSIASASVINRIRRVKLTTTTKLIGSQIQSINLRKIKLLAVMTTKGSDAMTFFLRLPVLYVSSAIQKLVSSVKAGIHNLDISPTIAVFFTLGYYDPDTLGTWDASTLGAMDYTT